MLHPRIMNTAFTPGERVLIKTRTHGCYNNQTGCITAIMTDNPAYQNEPGYEYDPQRSSPFAVRVKFDKPVNISVDKNNPVFITTDGFFLNEIRKIKNKEQNHHV